MFEWGGISVDPNRQVAIANPMALPFVSKLIPRGPGNPMEPPKDAKGSGTESGVQPQYGVPYGVTLNPFLSPFGLPCKQPAWGYISALDLKTNEVVWKKRIGTPQDSLPFPMPVKLPFTMGMPMLGGPISTAGNVLFIGATADNYLRAYQYEQRREAVGSPSASRRSGDSDDLRSEWQTVCCHLCRRSRLRSVPKWAIILSPMRSRMTPNKTQNGNESCRFFLGVPSFFP
ncbi:glucose dehydrogenase [Klebsiella pneumoniae subsp. ozaenae]|uniref:Glucose dehydrogenase n=1 Tax=Klebsiella pneumoniae subsp. ozaenae TaxID=574 RepID=A0A378C2D0_KLEPO|nr:glucose dehydrogenase [Klebsiella pneumoniae subsp. ozaenae]